MLHVKPAEKQIVQRTWVGRRTRYEFEEPENHYLNCIDIFSLEHLPVTYLPSSVLTCSLFPPQKEARFTSLVPRAKFCPFFLACVI